MTENLANGYSTTINQTGGIASGDTTVTVTSVTGAPAPNFRIIIDAELMLVTGVSGNVFTVTRGIESTTAASHVNGTIVTQILTVAGLLQYINDHLIAIASTVTINSHVSPITADTDGATITFNCATTDWHSVTLAGNRTLALSNVTVGQQITLALTQDGTGSRTVTWFNTIKWAGGTAPTLTTTANKTDIITLKCYSAGNYYGMVAAQNL